MLHSDKLAFSISEATKTTNTVFAPLSHLDSAKLSTAAAADALALAQVAWVCLCEGLSDANRRRYTWATVKLYYAAFQALRARLLYTNNVVFYRHTTPYSINAAPGQSFRKRSGNTHSAVFRLFRELFPSNPLFAQPIAGRDALEWIEDFRNMASYGAAPIVDPEPPRAFLLFSAKPRAFLLQCLDRDSGAAFDEDSALVALPFFLLLSLDDILAGGAAAEKVKIDKFFVDILAAETLFLPDFKSKFSAFSFSN